MERYNHREIEQKWHDNWQEQGIYKVENSKEGLDNEYLLVEFPYPSGNLHVGHWYAFSVPDIYARFQRMQGKNVLYPIGFDAFGLPAENAAIKHGLNPRDWTYENMDKMRAQIASMGASFDTSREVVTCDPSYYRWTQWLFIQLLDAGLVEENETQANWCPSCKTVLANEQVVSGLCERCDSEVEKKIMKQWQIKITKYADRLIDDLDDLDWPEEIKLSQKNWIGRSEGATIKFGIKNEELKIEVFTTRPDTLYGATYMVLAPEHELTSRMKDKISNINEVEAYQKETQKKTEIERTAEGKEKTGVKLEGVSAVNPVNNEEIPIFIADYVLADYGTGAIMAVPAHDERDFEFAQKYNIEIREVVEPLFVDDTESSSPRKDLEFKERDAITAIVKHWKEDKYLMLKWKQVDWITFITGGIEDGQTAEDAARMEILEETGFKNLKLIKNLGKLHSKFFHNPKGVNRFAHFESFYFELENGEQDVISEEEKAKHDIAWMTKGEVMDLVERGQRAAFELIFEDKAFTGIGIMTNSGEFDGMSSEEAKEKITAKAGGEMTTSYKLRDWGVSRQRYWGVPIPIVHCEKCGSVPVSDDALPVELPEVDDYMPAGDGQSPLAKAKDWAATSCPKCGTDAQRETDTLDTFVCSSWYFIRYTDPNNSEKFADSEKMANWLPVDLYSGGSEHTTMHLLYSRFWHKALFDLGLVADSEPYKRRMNRGLIMGPDGNKMSKSKGNVIDPDDIVEKLGADTMRIYLAFIGPYNEVGSYPWNPESIVGVRKFIERVWRLQERVGDDGVEDADRILHKTLAKVTESIEQIKLNTGVAAMMTCLNELEKIETITKEQCEMFITILSPYAPHIAEEIYESLGNKSSITQINWPTVDEKYLVDDEIELVVQVNGKVRDKIMVAAGITEEDAREAALASENVQKHIDGKEVKKVIFVQGKLISVVV